jgi:hypothetical protein
MSFIAVAIGAGAGLGLAKGIANENRMKKNDAYRKAAIKYSPWTGMGDPGSPELPGIFESVLGGGLTGATIGTGIGGLTGGAAAGGADAISGLAGGTPGAIGAASGASPSIYGSMLGQANMLGGVDMARQLGMQSNPYMMMGSL